MRLHSKFISILLAGVVSMPVLAADATDSEREARARLMEMARFMSGLDKFSVTIRAGYDVEQANGQKIQFLQVGDVILDRPDRMRVAQDLGEGGTSLVLFDGSTLTVADGDSDIFAQAPQPGTLDDTIIYFVRDLKMRLPLAPLFMTILPAEFERRVKSIDYVEVSYALDVPTHQIAARTNTVDFQIWIADGKKPLPQRVVLTYKGEAGQPQFWAEFSDWNLKPRINAQTFAFKPAPDSRQIVFAVQIPPMNQPPAKAGALEGVQP
ncbi:MAG: DUF2092 domain-containing protein [Burkholderiales bacterium]